MKNKFTVMTLKEQQGSFQNKKKSLRRASGKVTFFLFICPELSQTAFRDGTPCMDFKSSILFMGMGIHLRILPVDSSESIAYKTSRKTHIHWSNESMHKFSEMVVFYAAHLPNNKGVEVIQE